MGRAWDNSADHHSSVDDAAGVGPHVPDTAAEWSKLTAAVGWDLRARLTWLLKSHVSLSTCQ